MLGSSCCITYTTWRKKGVEGLRGNHKVSEIKETEQVTLTPDYRREIGRIIGEIIKIRNMDRPPFAEREKSAANAVTLNCVFARG